MHCKYCGKLLPVNIGKCQKEYCNNAHRQAAHRRREAKKVAQMEQRLRELEHALITSTPAQKKDVEPVELWAFTSKHGVAVDDVRRNMRMGMLHPIKQGSTLMLDAEGQRAFWELNHDYHKGWWKDCPDCPHEA